jgi:hypothetical protein
MQPSSRLAPARIVARLGLIVLVVAGLIGVAAPAQAAAVTAFTIDSEPGDAIGAGQSLVFASPGDTVTATGDDTALTMTATDGTDTFTADLAAPTGGALTPGTTYPTTLAGDATNAGLDVSGDGRSCNSSTGTLTVHHITLDVSNAIATFAATYEQHCDGATPALFGELRFNSSTQYEAVSADPSSIDFGTQPRTPSAPSPITITNTGSTTVTFTGAASITGTARADYSIETATDTCSNAALAATTDTCTISIIFDPSSGASRPARVELPADTARGLVVIPLTGKGEKKKTSVSLKLSDTKVNLNGSVTVTAHLEDFRRTNSRVLKIYATPYGGGTKAIKSGKVDRHGNLQARMSLSRKTSFVAKFAGDVNYKAATSPSKAVLVYASVKGKMVHNYSRAGKYALYHYTRKCTKSHTGCPLYGIKVSPNHKGKTIHVTLQAFVGGAWRNQLAVSGPLSARSTQLVIFFYNSSGVININLRTHVRFKGDADHLGRMSSWSYFRVTK